jgi:hypothetical protein
VDAALYEAKAMGRNRLAFARSGDSRDRMPVSV